MNPTTALTFERNRYSGNYSAQSEVGVFNVVRINRRFAGAFELSLHNASGVSVLINGTLADCKRFAERTVNVMQEVEA